MTDDTPVLYAVDGHVATLTLNRPDQRNAVSPELTTAMDAALQRLEADDDVWVGILTANGPNFCAGADLKAIGAGRSAELSTEAGGFAGFVRYPRTKPMIAAVRGFALAGGTELVLACDLVVAAKDSFFGLPEVTRGIVAAAGGLFRLPRVLGSARAIELILTADRLGAEEAHARGMVNHLADADDVLSRARELADRICQNAPLAVRESLAIAREALLLSDADAWERSGTAMEKVKDSADAKEGVMAFVEKRPARWTGR
ncbi:MAG: enoyl-CoA hydratase/isomerase family protein [Frankiales bacterium]|jgi:enoyl-CoA hydratase|nr:enoyl-CoA hydratase/isomerase family protein [Frankiales bacterium]